jgi:hypothetical protein
MLLIILEILKGQPAGSTARRHYFQGKRFIPAAVANPAVMMPSHGSGADETFLREYQVQETIQQAARI